MVHYVGNPGSTAEQIEIFMQGTSLMSVPIFVVGLKGEIIQCIPLSEMSAASNLAKTMTLFQ